MDSLARGKSVLLDVSRLVSRGAIECDTGIDRVERAYLTRLLQGSGKLAGIARADQANHLIDREGLRAILERRCFRVNSRKLLPFGLSSALRREFPNGGIYLNTGHSNLNPGRLRAIKKAGLSCVVFLHDTIPLDYPQFTRPDRVRPFRRALKAISRHADAVICNSHATELRANHWLGSFGRTPPLVVAHLGSEAEPHPPTPIEAGFVILGTIEPRKNHALLLDVWERLYREHGATCPRLHVIGRRGWCNEEVFARLDKWKGSKIVCERSGLSDPEIWALMQSSHALLFPSLAEGFGLPLLEARRLGVPAICSDIPSLREIAGESTRFCPATDADSWHEEVTRALNPQSFRPFPDKSAAWSVHFDEVFRHFCIDG